MDGGCALGEPGGAGRGARSREGGAAGAGSGGEGCLGTARTRGVQPCSAAAFRGSRARSGGDALGGWGAASAARARGPGLRASGAGLRMRGDPRAEWDSGTLGFARSGIAVPLRASPEQEVSLGISKRGPWQRGLCAAGVSCPWGLRAADWGQFLPGAVPRKRWGFQAPGHRTARSPPLLVPAARLLTGVAPRERSVPLCRPGVFRPGWASASLGPPAPPRSRAGSHEAKVRFPGPVGSLAPAGAACPRPPAAAAGHGAPSPDLPR